MRTLSQPDTLSSTKRGAETRKQPFAVRVARQLNSQSLCYLPLDTSATAAVTLPGRARQTLPEAGRWRAAWDLVIREGPAWFDKESEPATLITPTRRFCAVGRPSVTDGELSWGKRPPGFDKNDVSGSCVRGSATGRQATSLQGFDPLGAEVRPAVGRRPRPRRNDAVSTAS